MEVISDKQQRRLERKKKKLLALANLIQLNDTEQQNGITVNNADEILTHHLAKNDDTDKNNKSSKAKEYHNKEKLIKGDYREGPLPKKFKVSGESHNATTSTILSDADYSDIKKRLKEYRRQVACVDNIKLKEIGQRALLSVRDDERTPLFLTDLQHLIMWCLLSKKSPCTPDRWCHIENMKNIQQLVILTLEGLSLFHYLQNGESFAEISELFDHQLEMIMPPSKDCCITEELAKIPLTCLQAEKLITEYGSLEAAVEMNKDPTLLINNIFPVCGSPALVTDDTNCLHSDDKFPRTKLLLSALQMVDEGYPMPLKGELNKQFSSYLFTKDKYEPVTNRSPMFGVDCEMCKTSLGCSELTRISIVNEQYETVYETLVRPANKIVDYLTPYSGITPEIMEFVTKPLSEVQKEIKNLLPADAILVGQSLNCDLNAMRMMHPYVIDTSVCFNLTGVRRRKSKLRDLVLKYLQQTIQKQDGGHDSVEDSIYSLKLVKMKLANNVEFGDEVLTQKKRMHDIIQAASGDSIKNNLFGYLRKTEKRTAFITTKPLTEPLRKLLKINQLNADTNTSPIITHMLMSSNNEVVRKMRKVLLNNVLTLANINLTTEQLLPSNISGTLNDINKWIKKSWKTLSQNTMLIVLLGNTEECSSGVAMLTVKRFSKRSAIHAESSATNANKTDADNDNDHGDNQ